MPQHKDTIDYNSWFEETEDIITNPNTPSSFVRSLSEIGPAEERRASRANKRRTGAAPETTFGSQLLWGFAESAMVAPSLWESLGKQAGIDVDKGDIKKAIIGDQADAEWEDMSGASKAGYIMGAGAGMLIPFSAAGKVVKGVGFVGTKGIQATQKLFGAKPFLNKAVERELTKRAGLLTGKSAVRLADDAAEEITTITQKAFSKEGNWKVLTNFKRNSENMMHVATAEVKENLGKIATIPTAAVDDLSRIAIEAVKYNTPANAHAILEASVGRFPGLTGDILAAMSYDALLGTTYGFAKAMANDYSNAAWQNKGELGFSQWNPEFYDGMKHALGEGAWLSLLGPVRLIAGGAGKPLISVPRFWNKNPGKVNTIVGGLIRSMKPLGLVSSREAEATLSMMYQASGGALKYYTRNSPLMAKAFKTNPSAFWKAIKPGEDMIKAVGIVRKKFVQHAPGMLAKETMKDLIGSFPRMGIGALAMNASAVRDVWNLTQGAPTSDRIKWTVGSSFGEGWSDIMANIMVASLMMKSGRSIRRFDKVGDTEQRVGGVFAAGKKKEWMTGRNMHLQETQAGLEILGLSPEVRHKYGQGYFRNDNLPGDYKKATVLNMLETNKDYKKIGDVLDDHSLKPEQAKDLDLEAIASEGKHPTLDVAYTEAMKEKDITPEQKKEMREDYLIANTIIKDYEAMTPGDIVFKPMTPSEAREMIYSLANMEINGVHTTRSNIVQQLKVLQNVAGMDAVYNTHSTIMEYFWNVSEALGLDNVKRDAKKGVIYAPKQLKLPYQSKEVGADTKGQDSADMVDTWNHVYNMGVANGWIIPVKATVKGEYDTSGDMWGEAVVVHNKAVLEMHKYVYGFDKTKENLAEANEWDAWILSSDSFHIAYRVAKLFRQGEQVKDFMFGDYKKMGTDIDLETIERLAGKVNTVFGTNKIELDVTKGTEGLDKIELQHLEEFVQNFNRIYSMSQHTESSSIKSQKVSVADAIEIKDGVFNAFGDAFTNKEAMRHIENTVLEEAVNKLDLPGVDKNIKKGIIVLQRDRDFTPSPGALRKRGDVDSFLDMMQKAYGKSQKEVNMLKDFYLDIWKATGESNIISFVKDQPTEGKHEQIWNALARAELASRRENQLKLIEDSFDSREEINDQIETVNKNMAKLIDPETNEIVDQDLYNILDKTSRTAKTLTDQITIALNENNLAVLRAIQGEGVNISQIMNEVAHGTADTPYERYQIQLAKLALETTELATSLTKTDVDNIIEERIQMSGTVDRDRADVEPINKITPAQFQMKYQTDLDTFVLLEKALHESWQTDGSAVKLLNRAKSEVIDMAKSMEIDADVELFNKAIKHLEKLDEEQKIMDTKDIVDFLFEPMYQHSLSSIEYKVNELGTLNDANLPTLKTELLTDLFQIMTNAYTTKQVRMFEFRRGGFQLSKITVPNTNKTGFLGLETFIPSLQGNMFLLKHSAITADGRHHRQIDATVVSEIEEAMRAPMFVNSSEARKALSETGDVEQLIRNSDLLVSPNGKDFTLVRLDEGTDLIVELNEDVYRGLKLAYSDLTSDLRTRMINSGVNFNNSRTKEKLARFGVSKNTDFERTAENIRDAIILARAIIDSPSMVKGYLEGTITESALKDHWKRLKMYEPKSGFHGTEENVDFVFKLYDKISELHPGGIHSKARAKLREVFGVDGKKPLNLLVINDEQTSIEGENLFNPFSYRQTIKARLDQQLERKEITRDERNATVNKLKAGVSTVDSITYLNRDTFEALMAFLGVKDSMIQYTDNGITIRAGALKPVITHAFVGEGGEMLDFLLKTSFQFNQVISDAMPAGVNGITFSSAAKKFKVKQSRDGDMTDGWFMPPLVERGVNGINMARSIADKIAAAMPANASDYVAAIPLESLNLKQASREHTGAFSANTAVHFSEYGMEGASRWTDIVHKLKTFELAMNQAWSNPFTRTAIMRKLVGYSQEIGDQYLVNTGIDYIIQNDGLMTSEWMLPIIERSIISTYLNGGNIAASTIYESSRDIMTPEDGTLSIPLRTEVLMQYESQVGQSKPVQRIFGGGKVSSFNADKMLKFHEHVTLGNSKTDDTSSLIVKFSDGKEGILVYGLSNADKASKISTLFVDGLMIRMTEEGNVQMYDMSKNMDEQIRMNKEDTDKYEGKFNESQEIGKMSKEALDYVMNPELTFREGMSKLEGIVDADGGRRVWFADLKMRQPRNQAGDFIIEKVEGITEGSGNVTETNAIDAIQILDSDNDFDAATTFTAAPVAIWGEAARLAGYNVFNKGVDIQNFISRQFKDIGDMFKGHGHKDNIISTDMLRSRFVKSHQIMTYINNMFGTGPLLTFQSATSTRRLGVRVRKEEAAYLNTSQTISKFVNHFIDVYKNTPGSFGSEAFVKDAFRRIFFHPKEGFFEVYDITSGVKEIGANMYDAANMRVNFYYEPLIDAIEKRIFRPLGKYVQYNRGEDMGDGTGYSRTAGMQEFASGYESMMFSLNEMPWNGVPHNDNIIKNGFKNELRIDMTAGLRAARDYFKDGSRNPFDVGMRQIHNVNSTKFQDVDFFNSDIGQLLVMIEQGHASDTDYNSSYQRIVNRAYGQFIENEMNMANVVSITRRLRFVENRLMDLKATARFGDEKSEYKELEKQQIRLTEAREDLRQVMGAGRDWGLADEGLFKPYDIQFKKNDKGQIIEPTIQEGQFKNTSGKTLVIRRKDKSLSEIIPSVKGGKKPKVNQKPIHKSMVAFEHGRRYQFEAEDQIGAYINKEAFGAYPTLWNKGEKVDWIGEGEYEAYTNWFYNLKSDLEIHDKRKFLDKRGRSILHLSPDEMGVHHSERKELLHMRLRDSNHITLNENSSLIQKYAAFHRMLTPSVDRSVILAFPVTGTQTKKIAAMEKVYMDSYGRIEQLAIEYLKDVAETSNGMYKDGILTPVEADVILKNILDAQKTAALMMTNKYSDYRLARDGFASSDISVKDHYLYSDIVLNQRVYDQQRVLNEGVRNAANILIRYANGEGGMIDPMSIYKAQRELEAAGIPSNETFMRTYWEKPNRAFGVPVPKSFKIWDNSRRLTGSEGIMRQSVDDFAKELTRCLK